MKTCPACAEEISPKVTTCPYCGTSVSSGAPRKRASKGGGSSSGMPVALIIVGVVVVGLVLCGGVLLALLLPAVQQAREAARRTQCKNNLKQIGLALHNYQDTYGCLPPAYFADASGKPMHSWRVLILPYLGETALYGEYKFSEPWDGPNNSRLLTRMPAVFACPSQANPNAPGRTTTAYAAVFGEQCIFRGSEPVKILDVTDGASNTMMVGEAEGANIPWMKPADIDITKHPSLGDRDGFSSNHTGGVNVVMCDGSVRFITLTINPQTLKAIFTRNGGEPVGDF
jgi:prepilin-type processing-associated H-X9-DG protein